MSDDGYIFDDEEDDLEEDLFWNDDGDMDMADDLAQHTHPSPVYIEDPNLEIMNAFSDWECYSDDYYDDDPTVLTDGRRRERLSERIRCPGSQDAQKRQPKAAAAGDGSRRRVHRDSATDSTTSGPCVKGTVFRNLYPERQERSLYEAGVGERVALLDDWREVFEPDHLSRRKLGRGPSSTRNISHQIKDSPTTPASKKRRLSNNSISRVPKKGRSMIQEGKEDENEEKDQGAGEQDTKTRHGTSLVTGFQHIRAPGVHDDVPVSQHTASGRKGRQQDTADVKTQSRRKRKAENLEDADGIGESKRSGKKKVSGRDHNEAETKEKPSAVTRTRTTRNSKQ